MTPGQTPLPLQPARRYRQTRRAVRIAIASLLGLVLSFYMLSIRYQAPYPQRSDFNKFYASARFLWEGRSIYCPVPAGDPAPAEASGEDESLHANLNPPFQTVLLAPLALLPYSSAFTVWAALSLGCGAIATGLVCRQLGLRRPRHLALALLVLLLNYGAWLNTTAGQFGMVLLLALVLGAPRSSPRGESIAGLALGVTLNVKVFVAAFVVVLVAQRRWRALAWTGIAALACALAGGVGAGFDSYGEYLRVLGQVEWLVDGRNASVIGLIARLAGSAGALATPQPLWSVRLGQLLAVTILAATAYSAWRASDSPLGRALGYGTMAPAMLLASPLGWLYYFPALVLPLLLLWQWAHEQGVSWMRIPIAIGWVLSAVVVMKESPLALTIVPSAGLLVLWVASLVATRRAAAAHPLASSAP